jgi:hypothetical protein
MDLGSEVFLFKMQIHPTTEKICGWIAWSFRTRVDASFVTYGTPETSFAMLS